MKMNCTPNPATMGLVGRRVAIGSTPKNIIGALRQVIENAGENRIAFGIAAKFCPEPWNASLDETAKEFMFIEFRLQEIASQLEALFDKGSDHLSQDQQEAA